MEYKITSSGEIRVNCPFCIKRGKPRPDRKFHLYISPEKGVYHCFRCEASGRIEYLPQEIKNLLIKLKISIGAEIKGNPKNFSIGQTIPLNSNTLLAITTRHWLKTKRGLDDEIIEYLSRGVIEIIPNSFSIKINSINRQGEIDYFVIRSLLTNKYLNPPITLYSKGLFKFKIEDYIDTLNITEGVFDAFSLYPYPSVALLGKSLSQKQKEELLEMKPKRVYILLDGDARKEIRQIANILKPFIPEIFVGILPEEEDPNSLRGNVRPYIRKYDTLAEILLSSNNLLE